MTNRTVLVSGASGFVGHALIQTLDQSGQLVRGAYRQAPEPGTAQVSVGDIGPDTDWSNALADVQAVVHCAARVHVMRDARSAKSLDSFRKVNVEGTANLARQAATAGVKRLVFVSSIKVNGETTTGLRPFTYDSQPAPQDPYGVSKWEAEQELWRISGETGLEIVVVRPPLVYGPGVKANFKRLMQAVDRRIPLPFGAIQNRRSMVYLNNLCDLLAVCAVHPCAPRHTFLVSDMRDVSTKELVQHLAYGMGVRPVLLPVPPGLIQRAAGLFNKEAFADRLLGSLQVDISHTCKVLDWTPPFSLEDGLSSTTSAFLQENRR